MTSPRPRSYLHGEETVVYAAVYADAGYQGIEKRPEMQGRGIGFRVPCGQASAGPLPDTPEGRVYDLIETAKAHFRAMVGHPFRLIKSLRKTLQEAHFLQAADFLLFSALSAAHRRQDEALLGCF